MTRQPRTPEHFPRMKHRAAGRRLGLRGHGARRRRDLLADYTSALSAAFDELLIARTVEHYAINTLRPRRRLRINHCIQCIDELLDPESPHHDPSPDCTAGGYDHCTCTTCH